MIFQPSGGTAMVRTALLGFIFLTFAPGCLSAGCGSYVKGEVPDWIRMVNVEDKDGPKVQLGVFLDTFGFVMHKIQEVVSSSIDFEGDKVGTNKATCSGSKISTFTLSPTVLENPTVLDKVTQAEPVCLPDRSTKPLEEMLMMAGINSKGDIQFNKVNCLSTNVKNELECKGASQVGAPITIFDDKESSHKLVGFVKKVGGYSHLVQLLDPATLACIRKGFGCGRWNEVGKTPWATGIFSDWEVTPRSTPGLVAVSPLLVVSLKVPAFFRKNALVFRDGSYFALKPTSCGGLDVWKLKEAHDYAYDIQPVCLPREPYEQGSKWMMKNDGSAARTECTTVSGNYECTTDNKYKYRKDLNQPVMKLDPVSGQHQLLGFFTGDSWDGGQDKFKSKVHLITDSEWKCIMEFRLKKP